MKKKIAMALCLLSITLLGCTSSQTPAIDPVPSPAPVDSTDILDDVLQAGPEVFEGFSTDFSAYGTNPNTIGRRSTQYAFDGKYIYMCGLDSIIRKVNVSDWSSEDFFDLSTLPETEAFAGFDAEATYTIDNAIVYDGYLYAGLSFGTQSCPIRIALASGEAELLKTSGQVGEMVVESGYIYSVYYYNPVKELQAQKALVDASIEASTELIKTSEKEIAELQKTSDAAAKIAEDAKNKAERAKEAADAAKEAADSAGDSDEAKKEAAKKAQDAADEAQAAADEAEKLADEALKAYEDAQKVADDLAKALEAATAESEKLAEAISAEVEGASNTTLWFYNLSTGKSETIGIDMKLAATAKNETYISSNGTEIFLYCDGQMYKTALGSEELTQVDILSSADWADAIWGTDYVSVIAKMMNPEDNSVVLVRSFFSYDNLTESKHDIVLLDEFAVSKQTDFIIGDVLYRIDGDKLVTYQFSLDGISAEGKVIDEEFVVPVSVYAVIGNNVLYLCTTDTVYEITPDGITAHEALFDSDEE